MTKQTHNSAFIDSQNLNLAIRDQGWKLDFARFRRYLTDKYQVKNAFLFIGYISSNQSMYNYLQKVGYKLIFKPTLIRGGQMKGNVDAELVLHTMIQYPYFNQAIIVSGDGDFFCLVEYLWEKDKLSKLLIPNEHKYSSLLRMPKFSDSLEFLNRKKKKLQKTPQR